MEEHLLKGGFVNVDNCEEMRRICKIAGENPDIPIKLGLRINMDVGGDFVSRFGFEPGKADIEQAIYQADAKKIFSLWGCIVILAAPGELRPGKDEQKSCWNL